MQLIRSIPEIRAAVADLRRAGRTIGLVPTMGALHAGHVSLVEASRRDGHATVVTIFVNPTQFGPREDFQKYPRTLEADLDRLRPHDVALVFSPETKDMYPADSTTLVQVGSVAEPLEGQFRPGHFAGVATIVLKLFQIIPADVAYFGQKDYQQALVIQRMTADLNVPIRIEVCPIIRDADGLALSSRNVYLSPEQRQQALALSRSLELAADLVAQGERRADVILGQMRSQFTAAGIDRIDYVALANPQTLAPATTLDRPTIALIAAHIGATRLIDNRLLVPR